MRKRAVRILLPFLLLGPALVPGPAASLQGYAAQTGEEDRLRAADDDSKDAASDLYNKANEVVDSIDKESLRKQIREALEQMDEMGISPTAIAKNTFGIQMEADGTASIGSELAQDAQKAVEKQSRNLFQSLWDKLLEGLMDLIDVIVQSVSSALAGKLGG